MDTQFHVLAFASLSTSRIHEYLPKYSSFHTFCIYFHLKTVDESGLKINMIITYYSMLGMRRYKLLKKNILSKITRCLEDGADDFFLKPVNLSDVDKLKPHLLRFKVEDFCEFGRGG
ncbi:hypothetical protein RND81_14G176800 [Saponaria officinalis]|uniref:Uncharacterized protein n=1 Tax=Saponaria officinalis TaxID=3572 RepID=A0AAW1GNC4_SAPOF